MIRQIEDVFKCITSFGDTLFREGYIYYILIGVVVLGVYILFFR